MSGRRGMAQKNLDLIEHSRRILAEIQPTTVRGVAYQLFTRGLIENMGTSCVRNVSRMIVIARENGAIPWSWIVDETRNEEWSPSWNGLEDFGEKVVREYRKDFWQRQDFLDQGFQRKRHRRRDRAACIERIRRQLQNPSRFRIRDFAS